MSIVYVCVNVCTLYTLVEARSGSDVQIDCQTWAYV